MRHLNRELGYWAYHLISLIGLILLAGCGSSRGAVEREMWQLSSERAFLEDSTRHQYRIEVLRLYHPETGNLIEEREQAEGVETQKVIHLHTADTIYIEREKKEEQGTSAPIHPTRAKQEAHTTTRWWIALAIVIVVAVMYLWGRRR